MWVKYLSLSCTLEETDSGIQTTTNKIAVFRFDQNQGIIAFYSDVEAALGQVSLVIALHELRAPDWTFFADNWLDLKFNQNSFRTIDICVKLTSPAKVWK